MVRFIKGNVKVDRVRTPEGKIHVSLKLTQYIISGLRVGVVFIQGVNLIMK